MSIYDTPLSQRDLDALARETPRLTCDNSPCAGRLCREIDAAACDCDPLATIRATDDGSARLAGEDE
ncbi:hypothetical protein [Paenirhodobacter populi]|uniref:hypothetical protein n=1 Tax=Paenirhodobacter populi TaxID=2306993 RepID=UPI000FE33B2D|nr:hypothetical protein [Sinirhodobacter populi]RWR09793.1 hypothetical protein D2T32_05485 [Sinirhodobacter populi]